ncbi:MAG: alpha/beta fold hydrolase [Gammaproteobacteria bacterium]
MKNIAMMPAGTFMKWLRRAGYGIAGLVVVLLISTLIALVAYRDIPADVLEAKYANEESRFMHVDGVRIHFRDVGTGPPVVLIHAHFANLIGWDPWVDALKQDYRVIRFDMTSHGLTGPDPSGDYTLERTIELTERFVDALDLDEFAIAGTSMGGTVAMHYTARHPERISKLILLSPGALEGRAMTEENKGRMGTPLDIVTYITPRALPKFMLKGGFGDPDKVTDELVDRWYEMWMREGQREAEVARMRQYEPGDLEGVVASITRPVLLMWGEANTRASIEQAPVFVDMLSSAESVQLITYPGVGHMAVQEAGDLTAVDAVAFLNGTLEIEADEVIEEEPATEG